ncbi:DUF2180 family protein [Streptomyces sp. WMMC940]|uniref:DUF2180 family protein n=1 Tax=Streptomyces sp. WMMC940 TaxID=3015153 RepID=UPI0022B67A58|nr:DUF2180 family protein [Streptomyces sp. WMMC940]MCZ7461943.1 DUF2180 family protein [Streptomyces sp. WMMC940]
MNCYDCHSGGRTTPAVAVCHACGVALCGRHMYLETQEVHRDAGLGKTTGDVPARSVMCSVCRLAEQSVWPTPAPARQRVT